MHAGSPQVMTNVGYEGTKRGLRCLPASLGPSRVPAGQVCPHASSLLFRFLLQQPFFFHSVPTAVLIPCPTLFIFLGKLIQENDNRFPVQVNCECQRV